VYKLSLLALVHKLLCEHIFSLPAFRARDLARRWHDMCNELQRKSEEVGKS